MSDRLPGSSWDNPIWYRGYRIYPGEPETSHKFSIAYCHDDYDGAEDANDGRAGYAPSIAEAKQDIDDKEGDLELAGAGGLK